MFFDDATGKKPAPVAEPGGAGFDQGTTGYDKAGLPCEHTACAPIVQDKSAYSEYPIGLIGEVKGFISAYSLYPTDEVSLAGSIGFLSGICGREYQTYTMAGLNQYILLLALTGMGKDAIAKALTRLFNEIAKTVPGALSFKGPGDLGSGPALIKWLAKNPAVLSIIGEVGLKIADWTSPKASPHAQGLLRIVLQVYSKSDHGDVLDPLAYSDTEKNTAPIPNPSFTMIGEAEPTRFYEILNDRMIASGFVPRLLMFEARGARPYARTDRQLEPSPALVSKLADLCATVLGRAAQGVNRQPHIVPANDEAAAIFTQFERFTTDQINATNSDVCRHLWNRAHLKALKLATLHAVGVNPLDPVVIAPEALWATELVAQQTWALIARFANDETGVEAGNEAKQLRKLRQVIREYVEAPVGKYVKSACTEEMHRDHLFAFKYLYNRLVKLPTFAEDKAGATNALNRAIRHLEENDEIRRVTPGDMLKRYGKATRSYGLTHESEFMKGGD